MNYDVNWLLKMYRSKIQLIFFLFSFGMNLKLIKDTLYVSNYEFQSTINLKFSVCINVQSNVKLKNVKKENVCEFFQKPHPSISHVLFGGFTMSRLWEILCFDFWKDCITTFSA